MFLKAAFFEREQVIVLPKRQSCLARKRKPLKEALEHLFDTYSRVARLYPALIAIAPGAWTSVAVAPAFFTDGVITAIGSFVVFFGLLTMLAALARAQGKHVEKRLLVAWGGWPTTLMLRHRDPTIDMYTKRRYHEALNSILRADGIRLPSADEERADPSDSDMRYRAATTKLIALRSGSTTFPLIHKENTLYGFRRNLRGLKGMGLVISTSAAIVAMGKVIPHLLVVDVAARESVVASHWPVVAAGTADLVFAVMWLALVTDAFVRQAADEYAVALLKSLDELQR